MIWAASTNDQVIVVDTVMAELLTGWSARL
jgi:hypothetical protein